MIRDWEVIDYPIDKTMDILNKVKSPLVNYKLFHTSADLLKSINPNYSESMLLNAYTNLVASRKYRDDRWRFIQSEFCPNKKEVDELRKIEGINENYGYFMGLATNPVSLNVGMNKACPLKKFLFTYFHEAGHLYLGIDETKADNFAFECMYKLKYDDSAELLY